jgi:hypothetical protein
MDCNATAPRSRFRRRTTSRRVGVDDAPAPWIIIIISVVVAIIVTNAAEPPTTMAAYY